jgi:regulator of protease activity HflC (stomatin/prohibitin superfamily)
LKNASGLIAIGILVGIIVLADRAAHQPRGQAEVVGRAGRFAHLIQDFLVKRGASTS